MYKSIGATVSPAVKVGKVYVQDILWRGMKITTLLPENAPAHGEFLPGSVMKGMDQLWRFQSQHPEYRGRNGLAKLTEMNGELFIYLHRGKNLDTVIPVADMEKLQWVSSELFIGGRKRSELVKAKRAIAEKFDFIPQWNEVDMEVITRLEEAEKEARQRQLLAERVAREEAEAEARAAEEEARIKKSQIRAELLSRKRVTALTVESNSYRHGIPVVGDEWKRLPLGVHFCISVTSYDTETGTAGDVVEAFKLVPKGAQNERKLVTAVRKVTSVAQLVQPTSPSPRFTITSMVINGEEEDVLCVETFDDVKALRVFGIREKFVRCMRDGKTHICFIDKKDIIDVSMKKVNVAA